MKPLTGKIAVVIGASRGIGKGIAVELALAGATVYATGRTLQAGPDSAGPPGSLAETVAEIESSGGRAVAIRCDSSDDRDLARLYAGIREEHGRVDIVVHSAYNASALAGTIDRPCWEAPATLWDDLLRVGARSAYVSAAYAVPLLIASGQGLIVHISGRGAGRYRYNAAYGIDKAATDKLTADLAHELRLHPVSVVSVWPSVTRTELNPATTGVDEYGWPDPNRSVEELETPRYTGRAVVGLATDSDRKAKSGRRFWTAALAAEYGFTDENGRSHPIPAEADQAPVP